MSNFWRKTFTLLLTLSVKVNLWNQNVYSLQTDVTSRVGFSSLSYLHKIQSSNLIFVKGHKSHSEETIKAKLKWKWRATAVLLSDVRERCFYPDLEGNKIRLKKQMQNISVNALTLSWRRPLSYTVPPSWKS